MADAHSQKAEAVERAHFLKAINRITTLNVEREMSNENISPAALAGETRQEAEQECEERAESAGWCSTHNEWFGMCDKAVDAFMKQKLAAASSRIAQLERERDEWKDLAESNQQSAEALLTQRDEAVDAADELAAAIGKGAEGEHTNLNKPWDTAINLLAAERANAQAQKSALMEAANKAIEGYCCIVCCDWCGGKKTGAEGEETIAHEPDCEFVNLARVYEQVKRSL